MRAIWKGAVSFGLVSVPVRMYSATESKAVHFREVHAKDGSRIEHRRICPKEGKPVGIQRHIGRRPILAVGNSDGDLQMLQWTAAGPGPLGRHGRSSPGAERPAATRGRVRRGRARGTVAVSVLPSGVSASTTPTVPAAEGRGWSRSTCSLTPMRSCRRRSGLSSSCSVPVSTTPR